jgi:hypothetical protein
VHDGGIGSPFGIYGGQREHVLENEIGMCVVSLVERAVFYDTASTLAYTLSSGRQWVNGKYFKENDRGLI